MCRWFAYVSEDEECLLEDVLVTPKHSLCNQVHEHFLPGLLAHDPENPRQDKLVAARNSLFNIDGLGLCWYTSAKANFTKGVDGLRPALYKTVSPPLNDYNFRSICANTETKACFGHIRAASDTPITPVNNHPFTFGRHSFMHNGVVSNFLAIRREISNMLDDDTYANCLGSTDSETIGALYISNLTGRRGKSAWEEEFTTREMAVALHKAVVTIMETQQKVLGNKAAPNSLNLAATDGRRLVAYRFRNHETEQPPSLYYSTKAGVTLNRKYPDQANGGHNSQASRAAEEHGRHVIVASEPTTYKQEDWSLIPRNSCLLVEVNGDVTVESVPYEDKWNVEDPFA